MRLKCQLIRIILIDYLFALQVDGHIQRLDKDLKKFEEELRRGQYKFHCKGVYH